MIRGIRIRLLFHVLSIGLYSINVAAQTESITEKESPISISVNLRKDNRTTVSMECNLQFNATTDSIFMKNGVYLNGSSHYNITQSFVKSQDNQSLDISFTLNIIKLYKNDTGTYTCRDTNKAYVLTVIDSNALDLVLSGLFLLSLIFGFILVIYAIKCVCESGTFSKMDS